MPQIKSRKWESFTLIATVKMQQLTFLLTKTNLTLRNLLSTAANILNLITSRIFNEALIKNFSSA